MSTPIWDWSFDRVRLHDHSWALADSVHEKALDRLHLFSVAVEVGSFCHVRYLDVDSGMCQDSCTFHVVSSTCMFPCFCVYHPVWVGVARLGFAGCEFAGSFVAHGLV